MPEKKTRERAKQAKRQGKAPTTQAGEYVREEVEHVREGKHGARSPEQAIAIGLSKARRSGVKLGAPAKGRASARTRKQAKRDLAKGRRGGTKTTSTRRSRTTKAALKREGGAAGTRTALAKQARESARKRTAAERSAAARKGALKRTAAQRSASARKAARTRAARRRNS